MLAARTGVLMAALHQAAARLLHVPVAANCYPRPEVLTRPLPGEYGEAEDAHLHKAFVQTFRDMLRGLNEYVRTFHAKGVSWNMDGEDVACAVPACNRLPAARACAQCACVPPFCVCPPSPRPLIVSSLMASFGLLKHTVLNAGLCVCYANATA